MSTTTPKVEMLGDSDAFTELQRQVSQAGAGLVANWAKPHAEIQEALTTVFGSKMQRLDTLRLVRKLGLDSQSPAAALGLVPKLPAGFGLTAIPKSRLTALVESESFKAQGMADLQRAMGNALGTKFRPLPPSPASKLRLALLAQQAVEDDVRDGFYDEIDVAIPEQALPDLLSEMVSAADAFESPKTDEQSQPATTYLELMVMFTVIYPLAALILAQSARERLEITSTTAIAMAIFIVLREVTRRRG